MADGPSRWPIDRGAAFVAYSRLADTHTALRMQPITCDACRLPTLAHAVVNYGSMEGGYRQLCDRCFNEAAANRLGLQGFGTHTAAGAEAHQMHEKMWSARKGRKLVFVIQRISGKAHQSA